MTGTPAIVKPMFSLEFVYETRSEGTTIRHEISVPAIGPPIAAGADLQNGRRGSSGRGSSAGHPSSACFDRHAGVSPTVARHSAVRAERQSFASRTRPSATVMPASR